MCAKSRRVKMSREEEKYCGECSKVSELELVILRNRTYVLGLEWCWAQLVLSRPNDKRGVLVTVRNRPGPNVIWVGLVWRVRSV